MGVTPRQEGEESGGGGVVRPADAAARNVYNPCIIAIFHLFLVGENMGREGGRALIIQRHLVVDLQRYSQLDITDIIGAGYRRRSDGNRRRPPA